MVLLLPLFVGVSYLELFNEIFRSLSGLVSAALR